MVATTKENRRRIIGGTLTARVLACTRTRCAAVRWRLRQRRQTRTPMANPALSQKRFEQIEKEDEAGWAAPVALAHAEATGAPPPTSRVSHMTANGAFIKTFFLFLIVVAA